MLLPGSSWQPLPFLKPSRQVSGLSWLPWHGAFIRLLCCRRLRPVNLWRWRTGKLHHSVKIGGISECAFRHHFCCSVYSTTLFQTWFLPKFRSHFVGGPSVSTASKMPLGWDTSVGTARRFPTEYVVTSPLRGIATVTHALQRLPHVAALH